MSNEEVKDLVLSTDQKQLLTNYAKNYAAVKAIEKDMKAEVAKIKEVMVANNVQELNNGEYVLKLSVVNGVKQTEGAEVDEEFTKVVLDTAKANAHLTLTGQLPVGTEKTVTYKLNAPKAVK